MRQFHFALRTLARLRQRVEMSRARELGEWVARQNLQQQRQEWLQQQLDQAWTLQVDHPQRQARLLWLERQRQLLEQERKTTREAVQQHQLLYQQARSQRLTLDHLAQRRRWEHQRGEHRKQAAAFLEAVLLAGQGEKS